MLQLITNNAHKNDVMLSFRSLFHMLCAQQNEKGENLAGNGPLYSMCHMFFPCSNL